MDGHLPKPVSLDTLRHALVGHTTMGATRAAPVGRLLDERRLGELADGLGGDDALDALLHVFASDVEVELERLQRAVDADDRSAVRERAHALYSGASAFGATRAAELSKALEIDARAGELSRARDAFDELAGVVAATLAELTERRRSR
jgi:HPt (histidine-containing phosphotransfer) domain-containing protein